MSDDGGMFEKMVEMGMGMAMANQLPHMMNSMMSNQNGGGQTPPSINGGGIQLYASINGTQSGPFNEQEIISLIQRGLLSEQTLVWKAGMKNWAMAKQVPEVGKYLLLYSSAY